MPSVNDQASERLYAGRQAWPLVSYSFRGLHRTRRNARGSVGAPPRYCRTATQRAYSGAGTVHNWVNVAPLKAYADTVPPPPLLPAGFEITYVLSN